MTETRTLQFEAHVRQSLYANDLNPEGARRLTRCEVKVRDSWVKLEGAAEQVIVLAKQRGTGAAEGRGHSQTRFSYALNSVTGIAPRQFE
jgi:hypothetical protein